MEPVNEEQMGKEKLTEEDLNKVDGGYIVYKRKKNKPTFYIVDDRTGDILEVLNEGPKAMGSAHHHRVDDKTISPYEYKQIFGKDLE